VTEKFIEPGELLSPGKPIARISRLDTVTVKVYLTTDKFAQVTLGDRAVVSTESGSQEYHGTVVWTSDEAEFTPKNVQTEEARADLVYAVKVCIPNPDRTLKVSMPVFVRLEK
jgi:HlyD family secretion protein